MPAHKAGTARVSSTVTKRNPRPRKYASASERQAAYRARAPEVCFRAEAKTVQTLDSIAETLDQPRADLLLSMTKFALANHDWARFGLTHRPLPYGYGLAEQEFIGPRQANPQPIWKRTRPKSLGKPVPLTPKQKAAAKKRAAAAGRKYPNLVDNIAAARMENPTVKKPTPAQLAARARFAEMARSGAFKRKAKRNPAAKGTTYYVHANLGYGQSQQFKVTTSPGVNSVRSAANQVAAHLGYPVFVSSRNERPTSEGLPVVRYEFIDDAQTKAVDLFVYPIKREGLKYATIKTNPAKKTVSQKISQLTREGYPQKQAIAIALSEERAGKVKRNPADPAPYGVSYASALTGNRRVIHHKTKAAALKDAKALYNEGAKDIRVFHYMKGTGAIDIDWRAMVARTAKPLKRNPATGQKKSGTKLNPSTRTVYVVHEIDKPMNVLGVFSDEKKAIKLAQQTADFRGLKLGVSKHEVRG